MPCFGKNKVWSCPENARVTELLDSEKNFGNDQLTGYHDGTMVTSVYRVNPGENLDAIVSVLKGRMADILRANSWLMSRCRHVSNPPRLALVEEDRFSNPEDYIHEAVEDNVRSSLVSTIKKAVIEHKITYLASLWDNDDGKMTKFGILTSADKTSCAILFSLNHVLGDGSTLYQIWKMLDTTVPITQIIVERNHKFCTDKYVETKTSVMPEGVKPEGFAEHYMGAWMGNCIKKGIAQDLKRKPLNCWQMTLDLDEISRRKQQYASGNSFVSTNDIVLAWMRELLPKINHIFIPINFRNKMEGITTNMAGNYFQLPMLYNSDMESPLTVRNWLNRMLNPGYAWKFPTSKDFKKYLGGVNTSWTSFYHHVEPKGLRHAGHFPVYPEQESMMGISLGQELDFVVYKSGKDDQGRENITCCILNRRPEITKEILLNSPMVKEELRLN